MDFVGFLVRLGQVVALTGKFAFQFGEIQSLLVFSESGRDSSSSVGSTR